MAGTHVKQPQYSLESSLLFRGLPKETLERMKQCCSWRCYEPREIIIDYQDRSNHVFFVLTGNARVTIHSAEGKTVSFRDLGPGSMFGEYAAIDSRPRSATVGAQTRCIVASMSAAVFLELIETEPKLAKALLKHFVSEIRELTERVYQFSTLAVQNRIQAEVLRLANLSARNGNVVQIVPAPTHADIASRTSTHREAVTRELNRLTKIGIIEQRGRVLSVRDVTRLSAIVHDATGE